MYSLWILTKGHLLFRVITHKKLCSKMFQKWGCLLFTRCTRWWSSLSFVNTCFFCVICVSAIPEYTNRQMRPWTQSRQKPSAPLFSTMAAQLTSSQSFMHWCKSLPSLHAEFFQHTNWDAKAFYLNTVTPQTVLKEFFFETERSVS